jgi:hypothetical protein
MGQKSSAEEHHKRNVFIQASLVQMELSNENSGVRKDGGDAEEETCSAISD